MIKPCLRCLGAGSRAGSDKQLIGRGSSRRRTCSCGPTPSMAGSRALRFACCRHVISGHDSLSQQEFWTMVILSIIIGIKRRLTPRSVSEYERDMRRYWREMPSSRTLKPGLSLLAISVNIQFKLSVGLTSKPYAYAIRSCPTVFWLALSSGRLWISLASLDATRWISLIFNVIVPLSLFRTSDEVPVSTTKIVKHWFQIYNCVLTCLFGLREHERLF